MRLLAASAVLCALGLLLLARRSRDLSAHDDRDRPLWFPSVWSPTEAGTLPRWTVRADDDRDRPAEMPHDAPQRPLRPASPWSSTRTDPWSTAGYAGLVREWAEVEREMGG